MKKEKAEELLRKYREGRCSEEEKRLLEKWYTRLVYEAKEPEHEPDLGYWKKEIGRRLPLWRPARKLPAMLAAAASIVLVMAVSFYLFRYPVNRQARPEAVNADIAPGQNRAVLTLADGSKLLLSDTTRGDLAQQAGITVSRSADGTLVYTVGKTTDAPGGETVYNSIATPRGGQYEVRLPDGTKVWLNASSSLKFPVRFPPGQRRVELTGEAYFEVARKLQVSSSGRRATTTAHIPFIVTSAGQQVEVLGTHFNVSAYADEPFVKTTLLEGSVRVAAFTEKNGTTTTGDPQLLQPGQQAALSGSRITITATDPAEAIAWKDGLFVFSNKPLGEIMRQVGRWYDADISFDDDRLRNVTFSGVVSRLDHVSKVLRRLELTHEVSFNISGQRILVQRPG